MQYFSKILIVFHVLFDLFMYFVHNRSSTKNSFIPTVMHEKLIFF